MAATFWTQATRDSTCSTHIGHHCFLIPRDRVNARALFTSLTVVVTGVLPERGHIQISRFNIHGSLGHRRTLQRASCSSAFPVNSISKGFA